MVQGFGLVWKDLVTLAPTPAFCGWDMGWYWWDVLEKRILRLKSWRDTGRSKLKVMTCSQAFPEPFRLTFLCREVHSVPFPNVMCG